MTTNQAVEKILQEKQVEKLVDEALLKFNPVISEAVKSRAKARLTQRLLAGQQTALDEANIGPYVSQAAFENDEHEKARESERKNLSRTRWP